MEIKTRKEMEVIPQGLSNTETKIALYLRYREQDTIITLRVPKGRIYESVVTIDQLVDAPVNNTVIFGTKG